MLIHISVRIIYFSLYSFKAVLTNEGNTQQMVANKRGIGVINCENLLLS